MPLDIPCPKCGSLAACACLPPGPAEKKPKFREEMIKMRREKRTGREVIVLEGFYGDVDLDAIASDLKKRCGTGGTVKGRTIEIQGDHRDAIAAALLERGFRSKRAGG